MTILLEQGSRSFWIQTADWAIWTVFFVEFAYKVAANRAGNREKILLAIVVLLSFPLLPSMLGLVRIVRLTRLVRLLRLARVVGVTVWAIGGLRAVLGRKSVLYVGSISVLIIVASGGVLALLEPKTVHGGFLDGVWWAIVTATTVGYGDIAPTTLWGRAIAVVLMITGFGLISTLSASIVAHFIGQEENQELAEVKAQLTRIEAVLDQMRVEGRRERDAAVNPDRPAANIQVGD